MGIKVGNLTYHIIHVPTQGQHARNTKKKITNCFTIRDNYVSMKTFQSLHLIFLTLLRLTKLTDIR